VCVCVCVYGCVCVCVCARARACSATAYRTVLKLSGGVRRIRILFVHHFVDLHQCVLNVESREVNQHAWRAKGA
jgi:hypothetical protein